MKYNGLIESTGQMIQKLYFQVAKMTLDEKGRKTQQIIRKSAEWHGLKKGVGKVR